MPSVTGGCVCGAIRYEAKGDPIETDTCYCRDCQYESGGGPGYAVMLPRASVTVAAGVPRCHWSVSDKGNRVGRSYCADCGTPLFGESAAFPEILAIKVGSLDDPSRFKSQMSIWVRSAQPWHHIDPALPRFDKDPG